MNERDTNDVNERTQEQLEESRFLLPARPAFPLLGIGLAVLLAASAFFSGMQIGSGSSMSASVFSIFKSTDDTPSEEVDLSEFWEVWHLLEEKYVVTASSTALTNQDLIEGAISGLVDSYGDPYTVFLPPEDATKFAEDISGNFSGVGMEVGMRDSIVTIIAPLPDTPAERAGLLAGDQIVRIDDKSTDGMTVDEAVDLIRGEKGTDVKLTVIRDSEPELLTFTVTRDTIMIPTIETEQHGDIFVVKLYSFNGIAVAKMQEALREYVSSGADKMVLDLRGNPGGYLQGAVAIASYFLPTGKAVVRESFGDTQDEEVYRSLGKTLGTYAPKHMVVLVDGGSASASEILAGALQEHGVATLIGAQTFGKGSVQELIDLTGGASLKVTVARWLTPNGISISEGGLTPDIEVERTAVNIQEGVDPQMDKAFEYLRGL